MAEEAFGKYRVVEKIGAGGFGEVFRGIDPFLNRPVAIKTCSSGEVELRMRFFREAEIAANLQHPNVVTIFDFGYQDEKPYLVQEFLTGEDLDRKIRRREPADLATKLDILLQIAKGLEYAHSRDVVHRDVKPANVRVLEDGQVRIMDFGIAKLLTAETQLTRTGMALGTAAYLPPEQIRGETVDRRADLFSFGVLAYELMTYERPFEGESLSAMLYAIAHTQPQPVAERGAGCPPRLAAVIETCLAKDPDDRFAGFTEVISEIKSLSGMTAAGPIVPFGATQVLSTAQSAVSAAVPPVSAPSAALGPPPPLPPAARPAAVAPAPAMVASGQTSKKGVSRWLIAVAAAGALAFMLTLAGLGVWWLQKRSADSGREPEVAAASAPPVVHGSPQEPIADPEAVAGEEPVSVPSGEEPLEVAEPAPARASTPPPPPSSSPAASSSGGKPRGVPPPATPKARAAPPPATPSARAAPPPATPRVSAPKPESESFEKVPADPEPGPAIAGAVPAPLVVDQLDGLELGRIAPGESVYRGRDSYFIYERVPDAYRGLTSLKTSNADKRRVASLSFTVDRNVQVFVAHDSRIVRKPSWLSSYRRTGQEVAVNEGGEEQNITIYEVFVQDYPPGTVRLGPNVGPRSKRRISMYLVFLRSR